MNRIIGMLYALLFLAAAVYGQQKEKVAIINTIDDGKPQIGHLELSHLTKKLRGIASNVLPQKNYDIMTEDYIIDISGSQEEAEKKCEEAGGCLAKFGREIKVHYIAQARIGRFAEDLTIAVELYDTRSSKLLGSLEGEAKDVYGLISVLEEKAPYMFRKMPGVSSNSMTFDPGISNESAVDSYEYKGGKSYVVDLSTEPPGAVLSFNGLPISKCPKTPCSVQLGEGSVRIIANLEQYEIADTTVSIKQNNQSINIRLKPNFGVLEVKSAYIDGIGANEGWSLLINDKVQHSYESRVSPGNYEVKLYHECYEDISFKFGINKGGREVFDMSKHIALKKGGLDLSTEADDKPVSEPVFVNGRQAGETPFSGSVPVCARIQVGSGREKVNVEIKHNMPVKYVHKMDTEERRRREAQQRAYLEAQRRQYEEQQLALEEKQRKEQQAMEEARSPRWSIGWGNSWLMEYINPRYRGNGAGLLFADIEFVSLAGGYLRLGGDLDIGLIRIKYHHENKEDIDKFHWWRGGASAKLRFLESWGFVGPYLMAGAGWYGDFYDTEPYSGPSFSVGVGFDFLVFIDVQYFVMPTNGRNAGYVTVKGGLSIPSLRFTDPKYVEPKGEYEKQSEYEVRKRRQRR